MKYLILSFIFIHVNINCYSKTQKAFSFQYYDIKINIKAEYFTLKSQSNDHLNLIELNDDFEKMLNEIFSKNNFDNYSIVDFIVKLSNEAGVKFEIDAINLKMCLLCVFDFKFILLTKESDTIIGVSTNMFIDRYIIFLNQKFYLLDEVDIYNKKYNIIYLRDGKNKLSYDMKKRWNLGQSDTLIEREMLYSDSFYQISYNFNLKYIDYLARIPFSFSDTIFNIPSPSPTMEANISKIKKIIDDFTTREKLDFLLKLSQQIFYTDYIEIYNKERVNLPELTLFINTADCEDKSLLFSFLVWHIMHIKTVLITYPNGEHMNVGVECKNIECDKNTFVNIKNTRFIICDPSVLWYNIGEQIDKIDTSTKRYIWLNFN